MYIYSKCYKIAIFSLLSYGYPMGIIWVSYGADSILIAKCECKGTTKKRAQKYVKILICTNIFKKNARELAYVKKK